VFYNSRRESCFERYVGLSYLTQKTRESSPLKTALPISIVQQIPIAPVTVGPGSPGGDQLFKDVYAGSRLCKHNTIIVNNLFNTLIIYFV
jgi:hypothetical protein